MAQISALNIICEFLEENGYKPTDVDFVDNPPISGSLWTDPEEPMTYFFYDGDVSRVVIIANGIKYKTKMFVYHDGFVTLMVEFLIPETDIVLNETTLSAYLNANLIEPDSLDMIRRWLQ